MTFNTKYGRPKYEGEYNNGQSNVEKAGYIPPKIQIENLINAGKRLIEHRKNMYDFDEGVADDDNFTDPTRDPGFDMADASRLAMRSSEAIKKQGEVATEALNQKAAKIAAEKAAAEAAAKKSD
jgi:hypothetical protein